MPWGISGYGVGGTGKGRYQFSKTPTLPLDLSPLLHRRCQLEAVRVALQRMLMQTGSPILLFHPH